MSLNTNSIQVNEKGNNIINNSIDILKYWSNKTILNILFDSDIDGDGRTDNLLLNKVLYKRNLYFISFDYNNNVYGGFVGTLVDRFDYFIRGEKTFVFSLKRNGEVKNTKYCLKQGKDSAFMLYNNNPSKALYRFGNDIEVCKVNDDHSCCVFSQYNFYDYGNEKLPLSDVVYPLKFNVERIIIIEMS
ncbi:TLDc domain-containing protein [Entamoeba marina]